ncbi:hypothetical protein SDC9_212488 [bioreactor metagenome]|uniref:Uncharacterized protein n=1 Tax=bioreactor metagenome TaxID=1076179 RepID=A0A645JN51_9ZZZZ
MNEKINKRFIRFRFARGCVYDEHGHVRFIEHLPRFFHPQRAQRAFVVDTGRVNDHHRSDRQQLHGFIDRVGRGAFHVGYDGKILSRHRVDDT